MLGWLLALLMCLLLTPTSGAADDPMDRYLSVPGAYTFVRRAPEDTRSDRIRMTVFEDFLCPACYQTVTAIIPRLKEKYHTHLEVHFVGYPLLSAASRIPARAHAIAQELGLGAQMQQALFQARFEEHLDTTSRDGLARVAHGIGLDPELLLSSLDSGGGNAEVERNLALGKSYHIEMVPGILLDGWILVQTLSQENIQTVIDGMLEKKRVEQ